MNKLSKADSQMYQGIEKELNSLTNVIYILEKLENDKELSRISVFFLNIFSKEITYAVKGKVIRAQEFK